MNGRYSSNNSINCELIPIHHLDRNHPLREVFWELYNHPANNIFMYHPTRNRQAFDELFENIIRPGSTEIFVYHENGEPIGTCRIVQGEGPYQHVMSCCSTTIDPDKKRHGAGTRLKQAVVEYVQKHYPNIKRHDLTYEADNPVSQRLNHQPNYYEKCGYVTEAVYKNWWPRSSVNYEGMENNPFQSWLNENSGDHRLNEHFWPTAEIYAGRLQDDIKNYEKTNPPEKRLLVFSSLTNADTNYNLRLANEADINQLVILYQNSYTVWDNAYTSDSTLKEILKRAIAAKQLYIVENANKEIVAACLTSKHRYIKHTMILENIVTNEKHPQAAKFLLIRLATNCLKENIEIKRIELNIVAEDSVLLNSLEASRFEYCGTERGRFYDAKKDRYRDEHKFECALFRLKDAIEICENRLLAQINLIQKKHKTPFNVKLSKSSLEDILALLNQLKLKYEQNELSFEQENIIFRMMHAVCTQDYLAAQERRDCLREIKHTFADIISKEKIIEQLYQYCDNLMSMKCENQVSLYSNKSELFKSKTAIACSNSPTNNYNNVHVKTKN
ncbi:MAG TPA: GNAT family N-acetyltransferase [Gammaproteobacteria bacterium]|nr:GNAT family N-acetyltransferase [Gammaproteobacteria bacterium]